MADVLHCSFCGKSQHEVEQLIAGPGPFICDQCVDVLRETVETKRSSPDPTTRQARAIKLEEIKQLRASSPTASTERDFMSDQVPGSCVCVARHRSVMPIGSIGRYTWCWRTSVRRGE